MRTHVLLLAKSMPLMLLAAMPMSASARERLHPVATARSDSTCNAVLQVDHTEPIASKSAWSSVPCATLSVCVPPTRLVGFSMLSNAFVVSRESLAAVDSLANALSVPTDRLDAFRMLVFESGLSASQLHEFSVLVRTGVGSRFGFLNPSRFSRLGAIKAMAAQAERNGYDTDALWNLYWKLYGSSVFEDEQEDL